MACQYFSPCEGGADTFTVAMPKLTFGRGCLGEVGVRAAARGLRRVALFTDASLRPGVATPCIHMGRVARPLPGSPMLPTWRPHSLQS